MLSNGLQGSHAGLLLVVTCSILVFTTSRRVLTSSSETSGNSARCELVYELGKGLLSTADILRLFSILLFLQLLIPFSSVINSSKRSDIYLLGDHPENLPFTNQIQPVRNFFFPVSTAAPWERSWGNGENINEKKQQYRSEKYLKTLVMVWPRLDHRSG